MPCVHIRAAAHPYAADIEGEPELYVDADRRVYRGTRGHSADGLRIYAPATQPWPCNETLGWHAPVGVNVASDRRGGLWHIALTGNRHRISLIFGHRQFVTGRHLFTLKNAGRRLLAASHEHGRWVRVD